MTNFVKGKIMRVNARFEGVAEQQLAYLVAAKSVSVSEVLRLSVEEYFNKQRGEAPKLRNFAKHVGRYNSGHSDTSVRYKEIVADAIDKKYPRKP